MTPQSRRSGAGPGPTDPYLPAHGNGGYRVQHYDLDARLPGRGQPARRTGGDHRRGRRSRCRRFTLDLGRVPRATGARRRPAGEVHAPARTSCTSRPARPVGRAAFTVEVRYVGNPAPVPSPWGDIGWDELPTARSSRASRSARRPGSRATTSPPTRRRYRVAVTTASPYTVVATGDLLTARRRAAGTTHLGVRAAGAHRAVPGERPDRPVRRGRARPRAGCRSGPRSRPGCARPSAHDFGRHAEIMTTLERLLRAVPVRRVRASWSPTTSWTTRSRRRACRSSGANHVDGRRTHERLVVHELAHQWFGNSLTVADWRHIWLNEGFATYAEWLWSEASGGRVGRTRTPAQWHAPWPALPADLVARRPGRGADVRRAGLQARRADAARAAPPDRRRALLRAAAGLDGASTGTRRSRPRSSSRWPAEHAGTDLAAFFTAWLRLPALPRLAPAAAPGAGDR